MDHEIKERWLAALETSRKARGTLLRPSGARCCFGVLENLYFQDTGLDKKRATNPLHDSCPSDSCLKWAGIKYPEANDLACLNDAYPGYPVAYIRENL